MNQKAVKTIKIIGNVLMYSLFALLCIILLGTVVSRMTNTTPTVFGYQINVIATGSMEPKLKVGDVIISKTYEGQKLSEGDVVTYKGQVGDYAGKLITHQVKTVNGDGTYVTYGIATGKVDPEISDSQIQSVMVRKSAVLSFVYSVVQNPVWFILLIICPLVIMIVEEAISIVKQIRKKESNDDAQS